MHVFDILFPFVVLFMSYYILPITNTVLLSTNYITFLYQQTTELYYTPVQIGLELGWTLDTLIQIESPPKTQSYQSLESYNLANQYCTNNSPSKPNQGTNTDY